MNTLVSLFVNSVARQVTGSWDPDKYALCAPAFTPAFTPLAMATTTTATSPAPLPLTPLTTPLALSAAPLASTPLASVATQLQVPAAQLPAVQEEVGAEWVEARRQWPLGGGMSLANRLNRRTPRSTLQKNQVDPELYHASTFAGVPQTYLGAVTDELTGQRFDTYESGLPPPDGDFYNTTFNPATRGKSLARLQGGAPNTAPPRLRRDVEDDTPLAADRPIGTFGGEGAYGLAVRDMHARQTEKALAFNRDGFLPAEPVDAVPYFNGDVHTARYVPKLSATNRETAPAGSVRGAARSEGNAAGRLASAYTHDAQPRAAAPYFVGGASTLSATRAPSTHTHAPQPRADVSYFVGGARADVSSTALRAQEFAPANRLRDLQEYEALGARGAVQGTPASASAARAAESGGPARSQRDARELPHRARTTEAAGAGGGSLRAPVTAIPRSTRGRGAAAQGRAAKSSIHVAGASRRQHLPQAVRSRRGLRASSHLAAPGGSTAGTATSAAGPRGRSWRVGRSESHPRLSTTGGGGGNAHSSLRKTGTRIAGAHEVVNTYGPKNGGFATAAWLPKSPRAQQRMPARAERPLAARVPVGAAPTVAPSGASIRAATRSKDRFGHPASFGGADADTRPVFPAVPAPRRRAVAAASPVMY